MIIGQKGNFFLSNLSDIKDQQVAVVKNYGYVIPLKKKYPDLNYMTVPTVRNGLLAVSSGKADFLIAASSTTTHLIKEIGLTNLDFIAPTEFSIDLGFGVSKDKPILQSILNKTIDSISKNEKERITKKWVPDINLSSNESPFTSISIWDKPLRFFGLIIGLLSFCTILMWILFRLILERIPERYRFSLSKPVILGVAIIFIAAIVCTTWLGVHQMEYQLRSNTGERLHAILNAAHKSFKLWVDTEKHYNNEFTQDKNVLNLIKHLLEVPENRKALLESNTLQEIRKIFKGNHKHNK